jgi:hypothetical protein
MTTQKQPGTEAARHGTGDADLTIMLAAHDAFRRDLVSLVRSVQGPARTDRERQRSVAAGWELFKNQLHIHHTAEDELIWPTLRQRLGHSENALSILDEMEEEHGRIDPLLAAVDNAFAALAGQAATQSAGQRAALQGTQPAGQPGADRIADVTDALVTTLTAHLTHEERDGLPLIGVALTAAEWRGVGFKIARRNGLSAGGQMFSWMLDGATPEQLHATIGQLPPPVRLLYKAVWKPRFNKTPRW